MQRLRVFLVGMIALLGVAAGIFADPAWSQIGKTIKVVISVPPGGTIDLLVRVLADYIGKTQGQTIIVESRPGAGSIIAAEAVARATPDGGTLLVNSNGMMISSKIRRVNFDPLTSYEPICNLVNSPQVIVVNSEQPYRTLADLFDAARAKPGELSLASVGPLTTQHIAIERLKRLAKVDLTFVPFTGGAPAINALLGGHITAVLQNYSEVGEQLSAGKLRALATPSAKRIEPLPDLPTISESGYKDFVAEVWFGLVAPAKTPKETMSQLIEMFGTALQAPEVKAKLVVQALYPNAMCGADFGAHLQHQSDEYARVIRELESQGVMAPPGHGMLSTREKSMQCRAGITFAGICLLAAVFVAPSVSAQTVAEFYKGKTITVIVGSGAGGGYDTNTRLLARHMSRHIPGEPHIIVQNMPAASGIAALNHIYTIAPRDGTVFSAVINNMPYDPLFGGPAARFDVFQLNWLGSLSKQTNVCLAWKASPFKTLDDVMQNKMRVSATGATGWRSFLPRLFNGVAGTQFDVINGYDSPGSMLAVARGEVDGICADYATVKATQSDWIRQGDIAVLAQFGLSALKGLEQVPMGIERVNDPLDRQAVRLFLSQQEFGRPYVMPPEVPKDRLAALRAAFEATMTDPAFLEDAEKIQMDVSPLTGAELDKLFQEAYASSPEVVARTKVLLHRAGAL